MPFDRRRFLIASGMTGGLAAAGGVVGYQALRDAAADHPLADGTGILVVVTLYGGNDGLNTVIPYQDAAYRAARPELAYADNEVLPLSDGLALNPSMKGLHALWGRRQLAIVRGVSYPKPDHSHFRSMSIWQTASPTTSSTTGWLGRWLDAQPADPLRAIAIGPTLPPLLVGARTAGATVPTGRFTAPSGALGQELHALYRPDPADGPLAARVASTGTDLFTVTERLGPVLANATDRQGSPAGELDTGGDAGDGAGGAAADPTGASAGSPAGSATTPATAAAAADGKGTGGELGAQLDVVAACVRAGVPTRVYAVNLGGFDTHTTEKSTQTQLLAELDTALTRFQSAIAEGPHGAGVTTVVYSEFGRRVAANASGGTDHGTAGPVLVLGPRVRGGFVGDQPDLTDLDDGDLKVTTDFRSVYATLLENVLGTDAGMVLGSSERFPRLTLV
jgi:uncharacterized protein (DUF1501 family)